MKQYLRQSNLGLHCEDNKHNSTIIILETRLAVAKATDNKVLCYNREQTNKILTMESLTLAQDER